MYKIFKDELHLINLKLDFKEPSYFVNSQWSWCQSKFYLFYKFCLFGYCVSWLVWTTIKECLLLGRGAHAIMEFSYWILVLITSQSLVASFSAFYHHVIRPRQVGWPGSKNHDVDFPMSVSTEPITLNEDTPNEVQVRVITDVRVIMPWYLRLSWLLHTVAMDSCLVLTSCYWILLFDGKLSDTKFHNNAVLTFIIVMDHMITKQPSRFIHVVYSILYFSLYVSCTAIYCTKGNTKHYDVSTRRLVRTYDVMCVYKHLIWRSPTFTITGTLVVALLLYPVMRILCFVLYKLRIYLWERHDQPG